MATEPSAPRANPTVALLGRDEGARAQLRLALEDFGASLVHEGPLEGADAAAIAAKRPQVVLVSLDPGAEAPLAGLEPLLSDPAIDVIFNEAEITSGLSGWDQARWARHLAAKVLGHGVTMPPPPDGAEPLPDPGMDLQPGRPPTPAELAGEVSLAGFAEEAAASADEVPHSAPLTYATGPTEPVAEPSEPEALDFVAPTKLEYDHGEPVDNGESFDFDLGEIEQALAKVGDASAAPAAAGRDADSNEGLELGELLLDDAAGAGLEGMSTEAEDLDLGGFSLDESPTPATEDGGEQGLEMDDAVAALAAQLDALEAQAPKPVDEVRDLDFGTREDQPDSAAPAAKPATARTGPDRGGAAHAPKPPRELGQVDLSALSLTPMDDPGLLMPKSRSIKPEEEPYLPRPGIDLTLAPRDDTPLEGTTSPAPTKTHKAVEADLRGDAFPDSGLALAPLDEDEEPPPEEPRKRPDVLTPPPPTFDLSELHLETLPGEGEPEQAGELRRVIVLCASIGGPDALRTFLAGLPERFPALLVLAQHLESGYFERLAEQLRKVSKMPVRVAGAESPPAHHGEVLVVPSGARYRILADGRIEHAAHAAPTHYKPCIDDVLRDIADVFSRRATAIIFSGMAGDGIEGAAYLAGKGGEVWAQDPASCVVSSMVDGAVARGVVDFTGSPRELADRCFARFGDQGLAASGDAHG